MSTFLLYNKNTWSLLLKLIVNTWLKISCSINRSSQNSSISIKKSWNMFLFKIITVYKTLIAIWSGSFNSWSTLLMDFTRLLHRWQALTCFLLQYSWLPRSFTSIFSLLCILDVLKVLKEGMKLTVNRQIRRGEWSIIYLKFYPALPASIEHFLIFWKNVFKG